MSLSSPHRRGAPKGNFNALKHGFYTRRLKKHDLTGVESTDAKGLIEEIALIRVFTRRLIESIGPDSDAYELADILRALCLASSTITRVVKTQYLITSTGSGMDDEISEAIRQVNAEFRSRMFPPDQPDSLSTIESPTFTSVNSEGS
jgi:hypothetical protein